MKVRDFTHIARFAGRHAAAGPRRRPSIWIEIALSAIHVYRRARQLPPEELERLRTTALKPLLQEIQERWADVRAPRATDGPTRPEDALPLLLALRELADALIARLDGGGGPASVLAPA